MKESLRSLSFQRFKKNPSSYIAVGIFCGLFFVLAATLAFVDFSFALLAIPLIVLPFLFSSHVACYYLEANQPVTISAVSRYFFGFFHPQFRSSFKGIKAFLTSLPVYFGLMIVTFIVCYSIYKNIYGDAFLQSFANVVKIYSAYNLDYNDLMNALNENDGMLLTFFSYVSTIPIPFAFIWFVYSISFASISIYYRLNIKAGSSTLIKLAINAAYTYCKKEMRADWFRLNWPLLVLSLVGSIGGGLIAYFLINDITFFPVVVSMGSVILLFFFLPFYFANMEVIYNHYIDSFKKGNRAAIDSIMARIQTSIDLSEEEKKQLEKSFKNDEAEEE